jgi:hypothetical protein
MNKKQALQEQRQAIVQQLAEVDRLLAQPKPITHGSNGAITLRCKNRPEDSLTISKMFGNTVASIEMPSSGRNPSGVYLTDEQLDALMINLAQRTMKQPSKDQWQCKASGGDRLALQTALSGRAILRNSRGEMNSISVHLDRAELIDFAKHALAFAAQMPE